MKMKNENEKCFACGSQGGVSQCGAHPGPPHAPRAHAEAEGSQATGECPCIIPIKPVVFLYSSFIPIKEVSLFCVVIFCH